MAKATKSKKKPIDQYDHKGKKRVNNPPVGLVTPETDRETGKKTYAYDPHLDPQLVWSGKAERTSFDIPTVSLHVHERIDPRAIIEAVRKPNAGDYGDEVRNVRYDQNAEKTPGTFSAPKDRKVLEASYHAEIKVLEPRLDIKPEAFQAMIVNISQTDPRAKKIKAQDLIDRRYLDEMEKSGFLEKLWAEKR